MAKLMQEMLIVNQRGLHARASAKFVKVAGGFNSTIRVTRDGETVGGTSIMGLMMLGAAPGSTITVEADGDDAREALEAINALICARFGEE